MKESLGITRISPQFTVRYRGSVENTVRVFTVCAYPSLPKVSLQMSENSGANRMRHF